MRFKNYINEKSLKGNRGEWRLSNFSSELSRENSLTSYDMLVWIDISKIWKKVHITQTRSFKDHLVDGFRQNLMWDGNIDPVSIELSSDKKSLYFIGPYDKEKIRASEELQYPFVPAFIPSRDYKYLKKLVKVKGKIKQGKIF